MKKHFSLLLVLCLLLTLTSAWAEESGTKLGTMQVINCTEWVSLRVKPSTSSDRLVKVPLGAFVFNCEVINDAFIYCEYESYKGYILAEYLEKASAAAPTAAPVQDNWTEEGTIWNSTASQSKQVLSMPTEIAYIDLMVLGTPEVSETVTYHDSTYYFYVVHPNTETREMMYAALYDGNLQLLWARMMSATAGQYSLLSAFIGGTAEEPCVMLYNAEVGLQCLSFLTGEETWVLQRSEIILGSGICHAVDTDGTLYIAGCEGPDPVAISARGGVLWISDVNDASIYGPYRLTVTREGILCDYESGPLEGGMLHYRVLFDPFGEMIAVNTSAN